MRIEILKNGTVVDAKDLNEGSFKIGRSAEADIELKSPQVSKNHALLIIKGDRAAIVDTGSANGVFVNGVLIRKQRFEAKDEVRIAEFQIRIAKKGSEFQPPPRAAAGASAFDGNLAQSMDFQQAPDIEQSASPQLSPQEQFLKIVDEKLLVFFYQVVKAFDWRWLLGGILLAALTLAVFTSAFPIVKWGRDVTTKEALARAHTIVAQAVRENYRLLSKTNDYTRLTVEAMENEKGVLASVIIDPKTKSILAPAKLYNRAITETYSLLAIQRVLEGKEEQIDVYQADNVYIVAQPIRVFSQETNDSPISAIVMMTYQASTEISSTFQPLAEAGLLASFFALIAYFFVYKMISYPLSQMQAQLDAALKGESVVVEAAAKLPELEALATTINFSVSRLRQATGGGMSNPTAGADLEMEEDEYIKAVMEFDQGSTDALLLVDRDKRVRYVGKILEELVGMRNQYAQGQSLADACRDSSFAGTTLDLVENVTQTLGEAQSATLDINGISRTVSAIPHRNRDGEIRLILVTVKMNAI